MDNFTPLKTKQKKKFNKFLIFGNIFLLVVLVFVTGFYLKNKLLSYVPRATGGGPQPCSIPGYNDCDPAHERGACGTDPVNKCEGDKWCGAYREESKCWADGTNRSGSPKWCCNSTSYQCKRECGKCGVHCDTPTPTPTPTGEVTNTPTPTATPTPTGIITNTPTPTVTPSLTPTDIPATGTPVPTLTHTPTPTATTPPGQPTNTPGPTLTPVPVLCGTKDCDDKTNPCRSGYLCVQAHDGSNYCTSADFANACKANPSYNSCCTAPGAPTATLTPTEIILAKTTVTPAPPVSGISSWWIYIIPVLTIIGGILL